MTEKRKLSDEKREPRRAPDRERLKDTAEHLLTSEGRQRWIRACPGQPGAAAIAAGRDEGWLGVGNLLAAQPGRQADAEAAYHKAIAAGHGGQLALGNLLCGQRDRQADAESAPAWMHGTHRGVLREHLPA